MSNALDLLFFLGRPFSPIYSALMKTRERFFRSGVFHQESLSVPVISIGNLVLGGSGKTPTVQHIAKLLSDKGYFPAVICSGSRGTAQNAVNIVSDGNNILLSPALAGDEPHMLARSLPGVPVLTGKNRIFPCRYSVDRLKSDVILLDDGFQHLAIKKNLDIVLFESTTLAGNSRVFPGGPLREPVSALNRCHGFLLTGQDTSNQKRADAFSNLLQQRFSDKPVFKSAIASYKLIKPNGTVSKEEKSEPFFAFCGIANPIRFKNSLASLGTQVNAFKFLKDHAPYSQRLVDSLCKQATECGAKNLITTEIDFVKLQKFELNLPLYVLQVQHEPEQPFDLFILEMLNKHK
jgi:tetraacyldisaccharide 4'-kinase